jgi:protein-disulfide isomerase
LIVKAEDNLTRKQRFQARRQATRQRKRFLIIGIGLVAAVLIGAFIFWSRPRVEPVDPARLADDPSLGSPDAAVTVVEYGDFGCATCRAWYRAGILDQIRAQYGDRVRFVWRDFPIITAQSPKAAEAAQCAYDQGKFWEYHDLLYDRAPALSINDLKSYAAELGVDAARFNQCLDSGQHKATVDRDWQDALQRKFRGTPSFLVNDKALVGPPTFEYLESLIDPILASPG